MRVPSLSPYLALFEMKHFVSIADKESWGRSPDKFLSHPLSLSRDTSSDMWQVNWKPRAWECLISSLILRWQPLREIPMKPRHQESNQCSFLRVPSLLQPCSTSSTAKPPPNVDYPLGQHNCQSSESEGDGAQLLGHLIISGTRLSWLTLLSVLLSSDNCTNCIFTSTLNLWPVWPWVSHLNSQSQFLLPDITHQITVWAEYSLCCIASFQMMGLLHFKTVNQLASPSRNFLKHISKDHE